MNDLSQIVCPHCWVINRVSKARLGDRPRCGKCKLLLFYGSPIELSEANFSRFIKHNNIPLIVKFWAPWSSTSLVMSAAYYKAAESLEPHKRLCKVNIDAEPSIAKLFHIKHIPSLCIFSDGNDMNWQHTAMSRTGIINWANGTTCTA